MRRLLTATLLIAGAIALPAQRQTTATAILLPTGDAAHKVTLKRDGYTLTDALHGVSFDFNGDGYDEQTGWTDANSGIGFLALDRNGNGRIDNGKELYGSFTVAGENNGFNALSHDAASVELGVGHRSGMLEQGNPLYDKFVLWTDDNHNGLSEPYELQPLNAGFSRTAARACVSKPRGVCAERVSTGRIR
jgi:hypothetical protein